MKISFFFARTNYDYAEPVAVASSIFLAIVLPCSLSVSLSLSFFSLSNHFPTRECQNECRTFSTSLSEWPVKAAPHCAKDGEEWVEGKGCRGGGEGGARLCVPGMHIKY